MVPMKSLLLGLVLQTQSFIVPLQAFVSSNNNNSYLSSSISLLSISPNNKIMSSTSSSSTALDMARNRGLERREEGATPLRKSKLYVSCV
jgi:hypothetical protein